MKEYKPLISDAQADQLMKDLNAGRNEMDDTAGNSFCFGFPSDEAALPDNPQNDSQGQTIPKRIVSDEGEQTDKTPSAVHNGDKGISHSSIKLSLIVMMLLFLAWLLPSANVMNLSTGSILEKDRATFYQNASGNLLSYALDDVHKTARVYILEMSEAPTPVPDETAFSKIEDEERQNYNGEPIDYYKDETIEVKCWKEKINHCIFNFSEIWTAHPTQLRRTLVDNVISKKHIEHPLDIFSKTNGVVGMTADYCAFRSYGIVIQYGNVVRDNPSNMLDIAVYDRDGNFSVYEDTKSFFDTDVYKNNNIIHTFAFGPVLVDNYEVNKSKKIRYSNDTYPGELDRHYPRAAICQFGYEKHYLLCTVDYRGMTAEEFAEVLQSKGVRFAYNLDGGQTATLMFNKRIFNQVAYGGTRPVSDILYFATAVPND